MKIKVLQVVGAMNRAGTETMLMNIFRNIDRSKVQFDFISYSKEEAHYDDEIRKLGGRIIKLNKTQSIYEIVKVIKKYGPYDAVHSHTLFHCGIANIAGKLAGVKVRIAHAHTTLDNSESLLRKMYINSMRKIIRSFSTDLLACSKEAGNYLFGEKGLQKQDYTYFPNLIDYSKFFLEQKEVVEGFKVREDLNNSIVIGHIGRFIEAKNHKFMIEIIKSIVKKDRSFRLLLVGDGDLKFQIENLAVKEEISDYIRFVGIRDDVATMLQSMDIFVFPSLYEGLGLVLLEAQACGLPCIVSEAIQPEADLKLGLLTRLSLDDGADMWASKIVDLARKKEENKSKISEAFEKNGYSLSLGISKLIQIYK
ncbi:glycosyltransferase family 1 protein [Bacillaceae bacterium IKA-2]|nr:glycosyltransferase family 1 protein [Bacillaceae bacterium IKA-2]